MAEKPKSRRVRAGHVQLWLGEEAHANLKAEAAKDDRTITYYLTKLINKHLEEIS